MVAVDLIHLGRPFPPLVEEVEAIPAHSLNRAAGKRALKCGDALKRAVVVGFASASPVNLRHIVLPERTVRHLADRSSPTGAAGDTDSESESSAELQVCTRTGIADQRKIQVGGGVAMRRALASQRKGLESPSPKSTDVRRSLAAVDCRPPVCAHPPSPHKGRTDIPQSSARHQGEQVAAGLHLSPCGRAGRANEK